MNSTTLPNVKQVAFRHSAGCRAFACRCHLLLCTAHTVPFVCCVLCAVRRSAAVHALKSAARGLERSNAVKEMVRATRVAILVSARIGGEGRGGVGCLSPVHIKLSPVHIKLTLRGMGAVDLCECFMCAAMGARVAVGLGEELVNADGLGGLTVWACPTLHPLRGCQLCLSRPTTHFRRGVVC